jgi:hypothetical protein
MLAGRGWPARLSLNHRDLDFSKQLPKVWRYKVEGTSDGEVVKNNVKNF